MPPYMFGVFPIYLTPIVSKYRMTIFPIITDSVKFCPRIPLSVTLFSHSWPVPGCWCRKPRWLGRTLVYFNPTPRGKNFYFNLSESGKVPSSLVFQIMMLLPFRKVLSVGWLFEFPKMSRFVAPQMSTCYWFSVRIFHQFFTLCKRNLLCWCGINVIL